MADTKISALTNYTAPIGADIIPIVDTTNSATKGITIATLHNSYFNASTAQQGSGFASDTYLTGSNITIPSGAPYVGTKYLLEFDMTKTNVGTATPIITLRIGTNGSTSDSAICTFTFGAGTAAADTGTFRVIAVFRTVGSGTSAVLQGNAALTSNLTTTGLSNAVKSVDSTSSGFNSTTSSLIIGCSYNGGTSAAHTNQLVHAELQL
jgi:hypothetical protein